jgi:hypothetical protein
MNKLLIAASALLIASCATTPTVQPDGPDGYRLSARGKSGMVNSTKLQEENYRIATEHCAKQDKVVETIAADSKQARPLGGFPDASLRFRCVTRSE